MQNLPAKVLVIAIIGGGFMLTGDLSWLAKRGMRVLNAADVALPAAADDHPLVQSPATPAVPEPPPAAAAQLAPAAPVSPVPLIAPPAESPRAAPVAVAELRTPTGGPDQVAWASLRAGDRLVLWLAGRGARCLVFDVVDPAAGEALAYEAATVSADGLPLAAAGPPSRVVIGRLPGRQPAAGIVRGGMIHVAPGGIASSGDDGRWIGPVEAIRIVR